MARSLWTWLARIADRLSRQSKKDKRNKRRCRPGVEQLEARDVPSGFHTNYVLIPHGGANPFGSPGPTGLSPTQIRQAYGFNQISFNGTAGDGSGTTIAIVDAFDDPNIANDLQKFDAQFSLPDPTFTKVNQSGGTTMPAANGGWSSEIALDVEWAHAIAPGANILLVEANDNSYTNLFTAVRYAANQSGVVAVSMSWGGGEFSSETSYDSNFTTPAGHAGVTFVISSGDAGAPASYPATSPNVLAVGGTTLNVDSAGNILSESAWSGSGGGVSAYENKPSYQSSVTQSSSSRTSPDVAYDANPNTGFPVYDSYNNGTSAPWSQFGGTSDAAPQWAALIAIADEGRSLAGLASLDGPSQTLPMIYGLSSNDFHDVTSGGSNGSPNLSAGSGYDLVTGRGSPVANLVVADLVGTTNIAPSATHFSVVASPTSTTAGAAISVTVTALDASNNIVPGYVGTVHFTSSDTAAVLPGDYMFNGGDAGTHAFSVTLKTAGNDSVTAADANNSSIVASVTESVSPADASKLVFAQQATSAVAGAVISPAVTVRVLDAYGNLVSSDNSDQVTLAIAANPAAGTLSGTTTVIVSGGVATFNNLLINNAGNGYTLAASSGTLSGATSSSFNITSNASGGGTSTGTVIESFDTSHTWFIAGGNRATAYLSTAAKHDGTYGLDMYNGNDWIYRSDSGAQLHAGDTVSVWLKFAGSADGRAYFGFGASSAGTLSLVAAPNSGQLTLQSNLGFGFTDLASVSQSYAANHWYRLEVDWSTTGAIVGKLYDSNGTTLLNQVSASTTVITSGGIAFRSIGSDKYWDTVTATYGVNTFVRGAAPAVKANTATSFLVNVMPAAGNDMWSELYRFLWFY